MAEKTVNYTPEQTAVLVSRYVDEGVSVEMIAQEFGKSVRSIVAKLSREGVYRKKEYVSKNGERPVSKDVQADAIAAILQLSESDAESLTKANKSALAAILKALQA
jgi:transposase-like protein